MLIIIEIYFIYECKVYLLGVLIYRNEEYFKLIIVVLFIFE